jgi:simple sugar transport system permease protein
MTADESRSIKLARTIARTQELRLAIGLVVLSLVFHAFSDGKFFTSLQVAGVTSLASGVGLTALGVTILMISGEFDLSVSATFATAPVVMATLINNHGLGPGLALLVSLLVVAAIGLLNGIITIVTGVQSFIVTLAMWFVITSADRKYLGTFSVELSDRSGTVLSALGERLPGTTLAAPFVWMLGIGALLWFLLRWTQYGNWTHAAGHRGGDVARAMGVPVRRVKILNFALCSTLAGFAGCLQLADFGLSSLTSGYEYNLLAIVAAVIGGTSLFGTRGTIIGTLLGALLLGVLQPGLILVGTSGNYYFGLTGLLLIIAALANARTESATGAHGIRHRIAGLYDRLIRA